MVKKILFVLSVAICFQSCLSEPEAAEFADLSGLFVINLNQELGADRQFQIELSLIDDRGCDNIDIQSFLTESESNISLDVTSLEIPIECNGDLRKISKTHDVDSGPNVYDFDLTLAGADASSGSLSISENQMRLTFTNIVSILDGELSIIKIQDDHLWGYIDFEGLEASQNELRQLIFQGLEDMDSFPNISPGYYGHFRIFEDSTIDVFNAAENASTYHAYYTIPEWQQLKNNVEAALENPNFDSARIYFVNAFGDEIGG